MLSSHSIVSSPRTVRPRSPWGCRWIGHWRTTWSTVCSSAPHSQATEETIPHLHKQEWKSPTPVRRRLRVWRFWAHLGRVIPGGGRCRGWKCGVMWGCPPTLHSIGDPPTAPHVWCCFQINWWDVVRRVQMGVSIWGAVRLGRLFAEAWVAIHRVVAPAPQPEPASLSGARRVMSASCEVTQGVGDTWATCPTLLRGIWARSRRAGFRWSDTINFQATWKLTTNKNAPGNNCNLLMFCWHHKVSHDIATTAVAFNIIFNNTQEVNIGLLLCRIRCNFL